VGAAEVMDWIAFFFLLNIGDEEWRWEYDGEVYFWMGGRKGGKVDGMV